MCVCVCVCVCDKEREREARDSQPSSPVATQRLAEASLEGRLPPPLLCRWTQLTTCAGCSAKPRACWEAGSGSSSSSSSRVPRQWRSSPCASRAWACSTCGEHGSGLGGGGKQKIMKRGQAFPSPGHFNREWSSVWVRLQKGSDPAPACFALVMPQAHLRGLPHGRA